MSDYFGNNYLLFCLHEFCAVEHREPDTWDDVFEFLNYVQVKNVLFETAQKAGNKR